ncbi:hypothetical protein HPB50_011053 [Hyalomma asiaticum]|uniref:Uncharacterized protein n=1 Tax=Hyalomma asiaticum TaxID=266040 RepID=A0ACB7SFU8_HYAAI|nr:hypothetical protein HPB50_011053 [Hyalomma asiaticum]
MNGVRPVQQDTSHGEKKKRNYKLLVDPAMKKGAVKVYRYDGVVPGQENLYPPVQVRDPRSRLTLLWARTEVSDLPVPKFKIDEHYVGVPPPLEVTLTNLNDNIGKAFLDDLLKKFGQIDESVVYYHARTRKHLGLARVIFSTTKSARYCVEKMHLSSVMGNILNVFLDPFGRECQRLYEEMSSDRPKFSEPTPYVPDPPPPPPSQVVPTPPPAGRIHHPSPAPPPPADYGYSNHSDYGSGSYRSNQSTPMSYDSGYSYCSSSQYAAPSHSWEVNHSGTSWGGDGMAWQQGSAWDPHADAIPPPKQSPARESLDSRIELLLKQTEGRAGFLDTGGPPFGSPPFGESLAPQQSSPVAPTSQSSDAMAEVPLPPLPPDSSPLPPLPERDELPPPPPEEEDEDMELLSTPPSPFISQQEYHHWARITREARTRDLSDSELDDRRADVTMQSNDETNQSMPSTRDSTPVHDELPEPVPEEENMGGNKVVDDDDDDRMSLSSLSSGEEKLQVNAPLPEPPNPSMYITQEATASTASVAYQATPGTSAMYAPVSAYPSAHPMYPSQEVQMMAQMGIWKPGMGSAVQSLSPHPQHPPLPPSPIRSGSAYGYHSSTPTPTAAPCQRLYEEMSSDRPKFSEPTPYVPDPPPPPPSQVVPTPPPAGRIHHPSPAPPPPADYGYSNHSDYGSGSYRSNQSTPMSYDSGYSYCSSSQYAAPSHSWEVNHSGTSWGGDGMAWQQGSAWDPHADAIPPPKQSPARESLDSRIELLLKQTEGRAGFLDTGGPPFGSPPFGESLAPQQSSPVAPTSQSSDAMAEVPLPPLPPDSSPLPPLPERDELPPPPPEEEDEDMELLSTPPSPFISQQEYHHWARITREARTRDLSDSELDDRRADVTMQSNDETNQSMPSTRDSTPVHDELPEPVPEEENMVGNKVVDDDDDDRMSLSSLSSGEEKLQVNAPLPEPPNPSMYITQEATGKYGFSCIPGHARDIRNVCSSLCLPNQEVQMMAQMGIWKPGMGSAVQSLSPHPQHPPLPPSPIRSGSAYGYHSSTPTPTAAPVHPPPPLPAYNPLYPPPPLPHYRPSICTLSSLCTSLLSIVIYATAVWTS